MAGGVAIVTGATRRIGLAIADRLAAAGFALLLHGSPRSQDETERQAGRLREGGAEARAACADLAETGSADRLAEAAAALGRPALLVNAAALFEPDRPDAPDSALLDRMLAVNLRAPILLSAAFAARVPDGCGAAIVHVLDQRVLRPNPLYFSYTLSKSALATATRTMAQGYAARGIRVNGVAPGPTLPSDAHGPEGFRREVAGLPLRRAVAPEAVAEAVLYLAGAESVTGQILATDSGQHLGWETPDLLGYEDGSHR